MPTTTFPKTYIVLGDDGRHVTLTRGAMPHLDDQREAATTLQRQGRGGWLVRMDGDYWSKAAALTLTVISELASGPVPVSAARAAFYKLRRAALGLPPANPERMAA